MFCNYLYYMIILLLFGFLGGWWLFVLLLLDALYVLSKVPCVEYLH